LNGIQQLGFAPWAYFHLGEMAVERAEKEGNIDARNTLSETAAKYFKKSKKFSGYDLDSWVLWGIKKDEDKIKELKTNK